MKNKVNPSVIAAFIIMAVTSCVGPFSENDHGKMIALPVGTPFEIRLEGNPDTDFTWQVAGIDTAVVKMILNPRYEPYNETEKEGGVFSYYFQTTGKGKTAIRLVYTKDGQIHDDAEKLYELEIDCRI